MKKSETPERDKAMAPPEQITVAVPIDAGLTVEFAASQWSGGGTRGASITGDAHTLIDFGLSLIGRALKAQVPA